MSPHQLPSSPEGIPLVRYAKGPKTVFRGGTSGPGRLTSMREGSGIDPGTAACGYGIVEESGGRVRALDYGWWKTGASDRPELRLKTIFEAVTALIEREAPDAVAIEESFVGVDARTALSVGQARGAVMGGGRARRSRVR